MCINITRRQLKSPLINPNPPQSNKIQQGEVKKMPYVQLRHRSGYHMGTKSLPEWRARDGQCIVVRETPGWYPGVKPAFFGPLPFRGDSLETKNPLSERPSAGSISLL